MFIESDKPIIYLRDSLNEILADCDDMVASNKIRVIVNNLTDIVHSIHCYNYEYDNESLRDIFKDISITIDNTAIFNQSAKLKHILNSINSMLA